MTRILANTALPGGARLLRVASEHVEQVLPGHWFRLRTQGRDLALPVLDASPPEGWLAFQAPADLSEPVRGSPCAVEGPVGSPIIAPSSERGLVLIADETGLPALLFAAAHGLPVTLALAGLESDTPPVRLRPSRFVLTGFGAGAIAGIGALEDAGIPSRAAHPQPLPGCQEGDLAGLVETWLASRTARDRWQTSVSIIGQRPTIDAVIPNLRGRVGEHHSCLLPSV